MSTTINIRKVPFITHSSHSQYQSLTTPDHNPLHHAAHYLKNAVTLESSSDETRRESLSADHAHVNNHGGEEAEKEFWEKHRKHDDGKTHCKHDARESHHHHGNKSLEHAEGHGKFQKMVEKLRTSDSAAREGGSMTG